MTAVLTINPAENKFETVTIIDRDATHTRIVRANGHKVWAPSHLIK